MQENWEDKVRQSFGSLSPEDSAEAAIRKESIWDSIVLEPSKKSNRNLWLLLFIGSFLFLAGWFIGRESGGIAEPIPAIPEVETKAVIPMADLEEAKVKRIRALLTIREKQIDSLMLANTYLTQSLSERNPAPLSTKTEISTPTDTIYITEIRVEQQLIEKSIKDTIYIEVPASMELETASVESSEKTMDEGNLEALLQGNKKQPSSIQFNFIGTDNLKD